MRGFLQSSSRGATEWNEPFEISTSRFAWWRRSIHQTAGMTRPKYLAPAEDFAFVFETRRKPTTTHRRLRRNPVRLRRDLRRDGEDKDRWRGAEEPCLTCGAHRASV